MSQISNLNDFHYKCFIKETTKSKTNNLAVLPTENAVSQPLKKVYYQVPIWFDNKLRAKDWGWKLEDSGMIPIFMTHNPAPSKRLKIMFCECKSGCGNKCSSGKLTYFAL